MTRVVYNGLGVVRMKHLRKKTGFTLIELIVVIAILAIISMIITPVFTGFINRTKQVACDTNVHTNQRLILYGLAEEIITPSN